MDTPGSIVLDQIRKRKIHQKVVASVAGIDPTQLSRMITGKRPFDALTALRLEAAVGVNAKELLRVQSEMELKKARTEFCDDGKIREALRVYEVAPISEMWRRGWLPELTFTDLTDITKVANSLKNFFKVSSINEIVDSTRHAAKKTHECEKATPAQVAWVGQAKRLAESISLEKRYVETDSRKLFEVLRGLLQNVEDVGRVVDVLADFGIRLVFIEKLKSSKIDGACFQVRYNEPAIAMSLRFDRIDNFWYVLIHELGHVINGDFCNLEVDDVENLSREEKADVSYANFLDPQRLISRYLVEKSSLTYEIIKDLSKQLKVHPGLVVGQIHHQTGQYTLFRKSLIATRSYILAKGQNIDGWGHVSFC